MNFKLTINPLQKKVLKMFGIFILALSIPLTLIALKERLEIRKKAVEAGSAVLFLIPDTASLSINETTISEVWLDSGSQGTVVVTSLINFNRDHLRAENINTTNIFQTDIAVTTVQKANTDGKITLIQGLSAQQKSPVIGTHKIAQIEFRAIAPFSSPSENNLFFDTSASKIANAQRNWMTVITHGARYQISERPTATPIPTSTPSEVPPTPTPTPTESLPVVTPEPTPTHNPNMNNVHGYVFFDNDGDGVHDFGEPGICVDVCYQAYDRDKKGGNWFSVDGASDCTNNNRLSPQGYYVINSGDFHPGAWPYERKIKMKINKNDWGPPGAECLSSWPPDSEWRPVKTETWVTFIQYSREYLQVDFPFGSN